MGVMELATCKIGRTLAFYFFFWLTNFDFSFKESVKYFVQWLFSYLTKLKFLTALQPNAKF